MTATFQPALGRGFADSIPAGIWTLTCRVGEPSQPCPTLNETTVYEPAAALFGVGVT